MDFSNFGVDIFNGFLNFVIFLANLIITPIIELLKQIIPNLDSAINSATELINTGITHIPLLINLLCIPRGALVLLFDFITFLLLYYSAIGFYHFVVRIISLFK